MFFDYTHQASRCSVALCACVRACVLKSVGVCLQYGMLDPSNIGDTGLPLTCRAVFVIGPDKKLKLTLNYPASVGRWVCTGSKGGNVCVCVCVCGL